MELILHILCERDILKRICWNKSSLENLASSKRISGLLKNGTVSCAVRSRDDSRRESSRHRTWQAARRRCAGLVEPTGIEPVTSCLQSRRSPS